MAKLPPTNIEMISEIPLIIEKTVGLGFLLCLDTLLHELTFMWLNVVSLIFKLLVFVVLGVFSDISYFFSSRTAVLKSAFGFGDVENT